MDRETSEHLRQLERRLERHFEALHEAIDQRDNLALDAAWGIVTASYLIAAFVAASMIERWLEWPWWAGALVYIVALFAALGLGSEYVERGRQGDKRKLHQFPQWRPHDPSDD
jgi:hypothetical protein